MLQLIHMHPVIVGMAAYWVFSSIVGGMPATTKDSSSGYLWAYNSLHILAGNLTAAMKSKYPDLPSGATVTEITASSTTVKAPMVLLAMGLGSLLLLAGCTSWERTTYNTLATSQAVITQASQDYNAGKIAKTQKAHDALDLAQKAHNATVLSFQEYAYARDALKAGKGTQADVDARITGVNSAIATLLLEIQAVKSLQTSTEAAWETMHRPQLFTQAY